MENQSFKNMTSDALEKSIALNNKAPQVNEAASVFKTSVILHEIIFEIKFLGENNFS